MKTKNLFSVLAVVLALVSCNKETAIDQNPNGNPSEEKEVVTNFKISIASGATKNGGAQVTPLPEESNIKSLTILVFKDLNKDDLTQCPFEAALTLTEQQLKEVPISAKILTTPGEKIVIAYANDADVISYGTAEAYSSYGAFIDQKFPAAEMSIATATKGVVDIKNIINENEGFMMVSDETRTTVVADDENAVTLQLNRMTSKVQVKARKDVDGNLLVSDTFNPRHFSDKVTFGTPGDVRYTPSIYQQLVGLKRPSSGKGGGIVGSTYIYYDSPNTLYPDPTLWKSVHAYEDDVWSGDATTSAYLTENMIAERPQNNNTTCLVVRVPVNFKEDATYSDGTPITDATQGKFWVVCKFQDAQTAEAASNGDYSRYDKLDKLEPYQGVYGSFSAAETAIEKLENKELYGVVAFDKYSYFRINLSRKYEAASHAVYSTPRNSFYAITINNISSFGWPTPEGLTDGDQTEEIDDKRLGITAGIEVAPWTVYEQDETLD